jgi:tripartite-type tricarboxylate transporter receptor subunit TctC
MKKLIIAALLLTSTIAHANTPTEVVVLFPPGGVNDVVGRAVTESFKKNNINTITVNKPGADGIIGIDYTLKNKTDSLVVANAGSLVFNRITKKSLPYDVDRDFNLVVPVAMVPSSIVVSMKSGITNMDQFIRAAQTRQLNCGLTNQGTTLAFKAALKKLNIEKNVAVIPYKGTSQVTVDLLSGQLDCIMEPISSFVQHHTAVKAIIIANTSDRAYEQMPQIPLLSKWIPGFKFESWFGLALPKTMKADKQKIYTEVLNKLSADVDYVSTINNAGMMVVRPSADPVKWYRDEYNKWEAVRQSLNIEKID